MHNQSAFLITDMR